MTWLAWRQFRTQALVVLGILALLTVCALLTGVQLRHWYTVNDIAACSADHSCNPLTIGFRHGFRWLQILLSGGLLILPAVTGIFWGAPLVAREFDAGTYRLVWTQSVSRTRWLTAKVTVVGTGAVLASGLLSWLTTWWSVPFDGVGDKFVDSTFGIRDVVPMGYAAFAFALGLAAGLVLRGTLPAMGTTLVGYVAARMVVQLWLRPHFAAPLLSAAQPVDGAPGDVAVPGAPADGWILSTRTFDAAGHLVTGDLGVRPYDPCVATQTCFTGYTQQVVYQPGSRYWPFQWIETGLFAGVAALLVAFAYWWLRGHRRPGRAARTSQPVVPLRVHPGRAHDERTDPAVSDR
jgi:hypothetical protein